MPNPAPLPPEVSEFVAWVARLLADVYMEERATTPPAAEEPEAEVLEERQ